jgi:hypothetical protein
LKGFLDFVPRFDSEKISQASENDHWFLAPFSEAFILCVLERIIGLQGRNIRNKLI